MAQCSANIKAYDFKKISSEISNIKRRICYLESTSGGASSKFGVAGEDNTATQNRAFTLGNFEFSLLDNNGNTNLLLDPANDINFFGFDTAGDKTLLTGWSFDETNIIQGKVAGKTVIHAAQTIGGLFLFIGDYNEYGNGTYISIDDGQGTIDFGNIPLAGVITDDFAVFQGSTIKRLTAPIKSGVYQPIVTGVTNIASITATQFQYMKVGDAVTVSGMVTIDATAANTDTVATIENPVNDQNFAAAEEARGTAVQSSIGQRNVAAVYATTGAKTCTISLYPVDTNANEYSIHWTYLINRTAP